MWRNEYGSVMSLSQGGDGRVFGSYQSTTGSTGTFYVLGCADTREGAFERGRSVSLSIYWRSIGEDPADPSWHWGSGLGGQLIHEGTAGAALLLVHDMVATMAFPGQAEIGRHLDKLTFTPLSDAKLVDVAPAGDLIAAAPKAGLPCALEGSWIDSGDASIRLRPRLLDSRFGFAQASLEMDGCSCEAQGFIDPFAQAEGCRFQALSLSALLDPHSGRTATLSGSLDLATRVLTLAVFRNHGTRADFSYTQTTMDQFRLTRAP